MFINKLEEILQFFDPVQLKDFEDSSHLNDEGSIGNSIFVNSTGQVPQNLSRFELAFIFADAYEGRSTQKTSNTQQLIREQLYQLRKISNGLRIADLGNLKVGKNINEALFSLQEVCSLLFHIKVNVVIIGGSQLLTLAGFRAYKEFENNINLIHIDSRIDLSTQLGDRMESSYLNEIALNEASHIYNVSCVGYQSYFTDQKQIKQLDELYFEHYRLGEVRSDFENIEPVIRDGDLVSFDISSIRMSEAPAQRNGSPNGFYADEACRLARYAGISDRVHAFGLYEIDANYDQNKQTVKLAAQIIWYYLDGYINRKHDFPEVSLNDCTKYEVQIDEIDFPIVFYKSSKSGRWWLEVKGVHSQDEKSDSIVVSCTHNDYQMACKNEIPDRWWINFKKIE
ncbi:MAG: arginase family protein [Prolixibacteraceae bacterium]